MYVLPDALRSTCLHLIFFFFLVFIIVTFLSFVVTEIIGFAVAAVADTAFHDANQRTNDEQGRLYRVHRVGLKKSGPEVARVFQAS